MSIPFQVIPWLIILIPFLILAYFYSSLGNEVLIARSFFGNEVVVAPKSIFTLFRVPLIEVVCGAAIELMRQKFADDRSGELANFYLFWTILLYTVALKSLMQTIETVSSKNFADAAFYLTFGVVIAGILAAAFAGRKHISSLMRNDLMDESRKLSSLEKVTLTALLAVYLCLAFVPVYIFG